MTRYDVADWLRELAERIDDTPRHRLRNRLRRVLEWCSPFAVVDWPRPTLRWGYGRIEISGPVMRAMESESAALWKALRDESGGMADVTRGIPVYYSDGEITYGDPEDQ